MDGSGFSADDLKNKANQLFESHKDIDSLKMYLNKVMGSDVPLANFSSSQVRGLMMLMGIDKLHLEGNVKDSENVCKKMVKVVVLSSKSKNAFGMDSIKDILKAKIRLESDSKHISDLEGSDESD